MAAAPTINEAITRLSENENRIDIFTNQDGYYLTNETVPRQVESLPSLVARIQDRYLNIIDKGNWTTGTNYVINDVVKESGIMYLCVTTHIAGVFATDLATNKWVVYQGDLRAADVANSTDALKGAAKVGYGEGLAYADGSVGAALNERLPEIGNYAALRAYTGPVTAFFVRGVADSFDGGFGVFRIDATDTTSADNGGTVLIDASGRRWKRDFSGAVNVRWFGAKGDGSTNDTDAIQAAINSLPLNTADLGVLAPLGFSNGGGVFAPRGRYKITGPISLRRGCNLFGEGRESTQFISFTTGSCFQYLDAGRFIQDEIVLRDFSIWQDSSVVATSGAAIEVVDGPASVDSASVTISNVIAYGTYIGFRISAGVCCAVRDCNIYFTESHGVELPSSAGSYTLSTSTTFYNVYCQRSKTGSGFYVKEASYCQFVGTASDGNARYGYEIDSTTGIAIFGGAEGNTIGGAMLTSTRATDLFLRIIDNSSNNSHAISLNAASGTRIGGVHSSQAGATGKSVNVISSGSAPTIITGLLRSGGWDSATGRGDVAHCLELDQMYGFTGGVKKSTWSCGASQASDSKQLYNTGDADSGVVDGFISY